MSVPDKSKFRSRYALNNTFSGQAGELTVAATLVRAGVRVAQPLWTNDYTDLLILQEAQGWTIPIPVQVKSVQQGTKSSPIVSVQGLMKRYIQDVPGLCLAIYSPAHDKIWFIPSASNIRSVYQEWFDRDRSGSGRKPKSYEDIALNGNVPIRVDVSEAGDTSFDNSWLVDRNSPIDIWNQIRDLASSLVDAGLRREKMSKAISQWL